MFKNILNRNTLPLETAMTKGIGFYNIMIRPLIKLVERYEIHRNNNDEVNFLKTAVTKSINFWLQTEKKHQDKEKEIL